MERKNKLIIAITIVSAIGILAIAWGTFLGGPDLSLGNKNILVLACDKDEQPGGGVDMAFMVELENGSIKKYTPIYPGGMRHPTQDAAGNLPGKMLLHDSLWDGPEQGMQYAKEIVEANTGMHADAVVVVYDEGLDAVIDSIRPLKIDGVETNLSATDIVRENDNYAGYNGRSSEIRGEMSRGDSVMVLVKALSQAATDPDKRNTMIQTALSEYSKGNILMTPKGSFIGLMGTKGLENII
jgi:anionic cell wall polymer biosynthesis LytR-Cps2A-Psr (LCP) family protein